MAGGGIFVFTIFLVSTLIALVWLFKGYGEFRKKLTVIFVFLVVTLIPAFGLAYFAVGNQESNLAGNISFLLFVLASLYGFILPPISKSVIGGSKNERT